MSHARFPRQILLGGRAFFRVGELRRWVADQAGEPAPAPREDDEDLISGVELRRRLGGVSRMFIHRRQTEQRGIDAKSQAGASDREAAGVEVAT